MNDRADRRPMKVVLLLLALAGGEPILGADPPTSRQALPDGAKFRLGSLDFILQREVRYADLSSNGRSMGYVDDRDRLTFKDLVTGETTTTHRLQTLPPARLVLAPDGKRVATVDQNEVVVWDAETGKRTAGIRVYRVSRDQGTPTAEFSADGKRLALCRGRDNNQLTYVVLDADRDRAIAEIRTPAMDWAYLALSPNGKLLATWGYRDEPGGVTAPEDEPNLKITVWDADTAMPVHRFAVHGGASGHKVCFSPDGKAAAVVGRQIEFWDTATWSLRKRVKGREGSWPHGRAVAFSADGKRLAVLTGDGSVGLWDTTSGERIALVAGHAPGLALRFVDNDRIVVLGSAEYAVRAWEVPSGKLLSPAAGHLEKVCHVTFTPDGKQLLSVSQDGVLIRTDVATGKPVPAGGLTPADYEAWVGTKERLEYVSPDCTRGVFTTNWDCVRARGRKARVFDLATRKEVLTTVRTEGDLSVSNLSYSPRGTRFLLNSGYRRAHPGDLRTTSVWDMATGQKVFEFPQPDSFRNSAFLSRDDRLVAVVNGKYAPETKEQSVTGEVWDTANGKRVSRFELIGKRGPETAGISPDGRTVVVATREEIFIVDLLSARLRLRAHPSDQGPHSPVVFSPDGRLFAIGQDIGGSGRGLVQVWETMSGSIRHTFDGHLKETRTVAFSPNGRLLASGSDDSTVVVWDLEAATVPLELRAATSEHLWRGLAGPDPAAAHAYIKALASRPNDAVALIGENIKPASREAGGPVVIKRLIAQLDAKTYRDREAATKALTELGLEAAELLKEALAGNPSVEAEKRLKDILTAIAQARPTPDTIRAARAVEVLERIGTPEAKAVLRNLAAGRPGHSLTEDAKASLVRLAEK